MNFFYSNQTGTTLYFKSFNKKNNSYFFLNQNKFNEFSDLKNCKKILKFREMILFIEKFKPKFFFISATKDRIENQIIKNSKKFNYNVISIIDYPTNLKMNKRFVSKKKKLLPDKIYVPDIYAKKKMIKIGYPNKKLFIIKNPYLNGIKKLKKKPNKKIKILLIDQNFPGVNYLNNLKKLKNALIRAYKDCNVNIRQHPENLKNKKIKKIFENEIFEKKCKFLDNYSHIIGHSSTLMNIALLKGLNVLSFNPFNKKDFNCPLFERGLINEGKEFEDVINFINLKK